MNKPNFFIVGAPKCGTSAMNHYLSQHSDIFMAEKEIHFFGADLKLKVKLDKSKYLNCFKNAAQEKILGEASVWYLFSKTAARQIKDFSPNAKILIMLRNPIEVVHALHSQFLLPANEDVFDFEIAVKLDEERKKGIRLPVSADWFERPLYKDAALFSEQVKRYFDVFNRENVHIVLYDDFLANTEKTVSDVLQFLGVNPELEIRYDVINSNKQIRVFSIHRFLKNPPTRIKKVVRVVLPFKKVRYLLRYHLINLNIYEKKRTPISEQFSNELKVFFANDIISLGKLINRDLSSWLK